MAGRSKGSQRGSQLQQCAASPCFQVESEQVDLRKNYIRVFNRWPSVPSSAADLPTAFVTLEALYKRVERA